MSHLSIKTRRLHHYYYTYQTIRNTFQPYSSNMTSAAIEVQRELAARLEQDHIKRDNKMCGRSHRSASEQGPHPGYHLWGARRSRKRTSAPQMGAQPRTALILRSRRSWPVAPVASSRWVLITKVINLIWSYTIGIEI